MGRDTDRPVGSAVADRQPVQPAADRVIRRALWQQGAPAAQLGAGGEDGSLLVDDLQDRTVLVGAGQHRQYTGRQLGGRVPCPLRGRGAGIAREVVPDEGEHDDRGEHETGTDYQDGKQGQAHTNTARPESEQPPQLPQPSLWSRRPVGDPAGHDEQLLRL
ncbi:hypothetical protein SALBM311S_03764 [Streptomyces alboniger]